jgi:ketosteroid isomerase-like protein
LQLAFKRINYGNSRAIAPESEVEVKASGDLATSTFTWIADGKLRDGTPIKMRKKILPLLKPEEN